MAGFFSLWHLRFRFNVEEEDGGCIWDQVSLFTNCLKFVFGFSIVADRCTCHCVVWCRNMRKAMKEDVVRQVISDAHVQTELDKEFQVLAEDRELLRQIFSKGDSRVRGGLCIFWFECILMSLFKSARMLCSL